MVNRDEKPRYFFVTEVKDSFIDGLRRIGADSLMFNSYELLRNRKRDVSERMVRNLSKIKKEFMVFFDSGGFQFTNRENLDVSPLSILELYEKTLPDFGAVLDHPLTLGLSSSEINRRIEETLKNAKIMYEAKSSKDYELVAVIHGYEKHLLGKVIEKIEKIGTFNVYAVGSLVPLLKLGKGYLVRRRKLIENISFVRSKIPNKWLHAFGTGSLQLMQYLFYIGVDSVDSTVAYKLAAYGKVYTESGSVVEISSRIKNPVFSKRVLDELENCNCITCRKDGIDGLRKSSALRSLHNFSMIQKNVIDIRRYLRKMDFKGLLEDKIANNPYYKLFPILK